MVHLLIEFEMQAKEFVLFGIFRPRRKLILLQLRPHYFPRFGCKHVDHFGMVVDLVDIHQHGDKAGFLTSELPRDQNRFVFCRILSVDNRNPYLFVHVYVDLGFSYILFCLLQFRLQLRLIVYVVDEAVGAIGMFRTDCWHTRPVEDREGTIDALILPPEQGHIQLVPVHVCSVKAVEITELFTNDLLLAVLNREKVFLIFRVTIVIPYLRGRFISF